MEKPCQPTRVHDLRHSHASMLIDMGFSPLEIANRLRHESIKTTLDTYSHLYPDKGQQLADRLNQYRRGINDVLQNESSQSNQNRN